MADRFADLGGRAPLTCRRTPDPETELRLIDLDARR